MAYETIKFTRTPSDLTEILHNQPNEFSFSFSGRTKGGRHLCVDDRLHNSPDNNSAASACRRRGGRLVLADGL